MHEQSKPALTDAESESHGGREITRLTGKERLKNQGLIQVYKEHLERMNDQVSWRTMRQLACNDLGCRREQKLSRITAKTWPKSRRWGRQPSTR